MLKISLTQDSIPRRRFIKALTAELVSVAGSFELIHALVTDKALRAEAAELSREAITVDLHCHANAVVERRSSKVSANLAADMKTGGLDAGIFALRGDLGTLRRDSSGKYHENRKPAEGELFKRAQEQLNAINDAIDERTFALAKSPTEVSEAKKRGTPCAVLAVEGSDPLEGDPERIKFFYQRGVRVLQLMHYRINEIGDIQTEAPVHHGLTSFGKTVVAEMNRLGMVIDTAHASPDTLAGVLAASRHPVLFSHTGVYALRKFDRHLADKDIQAIAKKGGIIGVWPLQRRGEGFETFLRDIDHLKSLVGADHVGVGTDLFGLGSTTSIPTHKEFALVPAGLLKRGYSEIDVAKIVGGNFMRLFREVTA
ncbi:MAG TPA: membrane dipeptidase [Acidobacteriota bacterium]|nr:membrane dipeptidase [Acidobacteriota bacterium]